jgi:hypothetical protein
LDTVRPVLIRGAQVVAEKMGGCIMQVLERELNSFFKFNHFLPSCWVMTLKVCFIAVGLSPLNSNSNSNLNNFIIQ